ncbi:MAG: hypothetical protein M3388_16635 [Acidobacteriota bacterium]|nr:hypothetical protein [Acidobacteriota bacterium]
MSVETKVEILQSSCASRVEAGASRTNLTAGKVGRGETNTRRTIQWT